MSCSKLPFPPTIPQLYARALWDPKPTDTVKSQKQLAYALGYPEGWLVERTVRVEDGKSIIRDRIHFTAKNNTQYMWFHHDAAQVAAGKMEQEGTIEGSHLLPPRPLYAKGDLIQVRYEGKWYDATILKRRKQADDFLYSVQYNEEDATQDGVAEEDIRPGEDPSELAMELGFTKDWKASRKGARYILTAPTGEQFTTKKAAMKFLKQQKESQKASEDQDAGDPPWRTDGHEWIGRQIRWTSSYKVSGTRKVKVEQVGTVTGYIANTDLDSKGNPGFVSEITGKPANLFHVVFPDDPYHPYASHLINSQDFEEHEIRENLLPETSSKKRKRQSEEPSQVDETPAQPQRKGRKRRK